MGFKAFTAPVISESDKFLFSVKSESGNSNTGSNSWCAWFRFFNQLGDEWSVELPEGWDKDSPIMLCDRVSMEATSWAEILEGIGQRYAGCLNITINNRSDVKSIKVEIGPDMMKVESESSQKFYFTEGPRAGFETSFSEKERAAYVCVHDPENLPESEGPWYSRAIIEALSQAPVKKGPFGNTVEKEQIFKKAPSH